MTDNQKFLWTIAFSFLYLVFGMQFSPWLAVRVYILLSDLMTYNFFMATISPTLALLVALPAACLICKVWMEK
jgi:hypothetical protein